jgi:hypothetical protein
MHVCRIVTTNQLLSCCDGEPIEAGVAQHIRECAVCANEIKRIDSVRASLRAMPTLAAPSLDAAIFQRRSQLNPIEQRAGSLTKRSLNSALAAGVALFAVVMSTDYIARRSPPIATEEIAASNATPTQETANPSMQSLVLRSQQLDARLQQLPSRPHVERASTSATIDTLQQRIQWVDYQLSVAHDVGMTDMQSADLWQDRVQLMNTLLKVRFAEAQRFAALR